MCDVKCSNGKEQEIVPLILWSYLSKSLNLVQLAISIVESHELMPVQQNLYSNHRMNKVLKDVRKRQKNANTSCCSCMKMISDNIFSSPQPILQSGTFGVKVYDREHLCALLFFHTFFCLHSSLHSICLFMFQILVLCIPFKPEPFSISVLGPNSHSVSFA